MTETIVSADGRVPVTVIGPLLLPFPVLSASRWMVTIPPGKAVVLLTASSCHTGVALAAPDMAATDTTANPTTNATRLRIMPLTSIGSRLTWSSDAR